MNVLLNKINVFHLNQKPLISAKLLPQMHYSNKKKKVKYFVSIFSTNDQHTCKNNDVKRVGVTLIDKLQQNVLPFMVNSLFLVVLL